MLIGYQPRSRRSASLTGSLSLVLASLAACSSPPAAGPSDAASSADAATFLDAAVVPPDAAGTDAAVAPPDAASTPGDAAEPGDASPSCVACDPQGAVALPTGLRVVRRTLDSVEIAWDEPRAEELGTRVVLSDARGTVELLQAELPAGTRGHVLTNLASGTAYLVRIGEFAIAATCAAGACDRERVDGPVASATVETAPDLDEDGLDDEAELALATALRPLLLMTFQVSDVDQFLPTGGWSVPFRVTDRSAASAHPEAQCPAGARCFEIFYGLAYLNDCGAYPDGGCGGLTGHLGDSEFLYLLAQADDADGLALEHLERWSVAFGYFSAHTGAVSDAASVLRFGTAPSFPVVWVAQGKHGNYGSAQQCKEGGFWQDDCGLGSAQAVIEVRDSLSGRLVNAGEPEHRLHPTIHDPSTGADDYEVWSDAPYGAPESPGFRAVLECVLDWKGTFDAYRWRSLSKNAADARYPGEATDYLSQTLGNAVHGVGCVP